MLHTRARPFCLGLLGHLMMIPDNLICSVLGTPNEESWPGVKQLPDYKPTFPQWSAQDLAEQVPYLDAAGIDLLKVRYFFFLKFSVRS